MVAKNKSPYLVTKRIIDGTKTVGYVLENRGKEYQVNKDELIKLVEQYPNQTQVDLKGGGDQPTFLTVIEELKKDSGEPKKLLRTIRDSKIKNNIKDLKPVKVTTGAKLKEFKTPERKLITV
jgi:hypothetical protein